MFPVHRMNEEPGQWNDRLIQHVVDVAAAEPSSSFQCSSLFVPASLIYAQGVRAGLDLAMDLLARRRPVYPYRNQWADRVRALELEYGA